MQRIRQPSSRLARLGLLSWRVHATRVRTLFPTLALIILGVIWATTLHLIGVERAAAEHAATVLSRELVATYEAQAVRALREIDQTLRFVQYAYELKGQQAVLQDLKTRALLPPDLLFVVSIADRKGNVVASTRPSGMTKVTDQEYSKMPPQSDTLSVSRPQQGPGSEKSPLHFSRGLKAADGSFAGVLTVSVAAAYFVAGYEQSKFGKRGVLGILGTDGVFRARRTGDAVSAGAVVDYASAAPGADQDEAEAPLIVSSWDGVRRYTSARKLYDFPLTVIVGLSEDEQLAGSYRNAHAYVWWATAGSALLMLFLAALGRLRWQLDQNQLHDIAQRKLTEQSLRIAAAAFDSQEAMLVTDAHSVILQVNRAFTENTGYTAEELVGRTPPLLKSGRHDADFYRAMWETINRTGVWQGEIWDRHNDGTVHPKWLTISAVKDADGVVTNYVGSHFDITARKQAEERIKELAFFDQLTGLPNRTLLLDRLRQALAATSRSGSYGALLFIDLDNFKTLNDTLGHDTGDMLLKQVAQRLTLCVREGDTVARLGGDEFVVLLAGLSPREGDAATGIETVAEKIRGTLNQPYQLSNSHRYSTASIGVTLFRGDLSTVDELMKQADLAMYKSKAAGRNVISFFNPNLEVVVKERVALEEDLRLALGANQFLLHYQAQAIGEGRLTGAEALIRWQHPQRGMVSPAEFIPLAEETGLILSLGHWVLEAACTQLAVWATRPKMAHLTVSVNVSVHQFRQLDFVDQVLAVLNSTGANPHRLKLEITESLLVSNVEDAIEKMLALKDKGVTFSLDDFGTGYSSLSYLKRLPLDQLKIDQSFVRDVLIDPNDAAIAKTIIALAHSLGLGVIAEGVETTTQHDFLASSGCHAYQGYFFSRPLPLEGFEEFAQLV